MIIKRTFIILDIPACYKKNHPLVGWLFMQLWGDIFYPAADLNHFLPSHKRMPRALVIAMLRERPILVVIWMYFDPV